MIFGQHADGDNLDENKNNIFVNSQKSNYDIFRDYVKEYKTGINKDKIKLDVMRSKSVELYFFNFSEILNINTFLIRHFK